MARVPQNKRVPRPGFKIANLLTNDWSLGCLATAYSIEKFLMASRFDIVDEEYIEELKDNSANENTKNSTDW